jgi:hypothetical protein
LDLGLAVCQDGSSKKLAIRSSTRQNATESYPRIRAGHGNAPRAAVAFAVLSSLDLSFRCEAPATGTGLARVVRRTKLWPRLRLTAFFKKCDPTSILIDLVNRAGGSVPYVCYHPKLGPVQTCDTCMVEVDGRLVRLARPKSPKE